MTRRRRGAVLLAWIGAAAAEFCDEPSMQQWVEEVCQSSGSGNAAEHRVIKQTVLRNCTDVPLPAQRSPCIHGASDLVGRDAGEYFADRYGSA